MNIKRRVLVSLAALSIGTTSASAVVLNPRGLGQVLVYPYYTVNAGNSTMMSVVNATAHGKALKIRFHEGYNGRDVLDFNVYLAPFDVWVAQVVPVGDGAGVFTTDNTCTVPALPQTAAKAQPFSTVDFDGLALPEDGGPVDVSRTREGYLVIMEMGEVTNASQGSLTAISPTNGSPAGCAKLISAWTSGYWVNDPKTDLSAPAGGLYGAESILNAAQGQMYTVNAEAIDGFSATIQHSVAVEFPDLNNANETRSDGKSLVTAQLPVGGHMVSVEYAHPEDAISALFMVENIYNEYVVAASIGAHSDWITTLPTKQFYVDPHYVGVHARAPFSELFGGNPSRPQTSCVSGKANVFDRVGQPISASSSTTPTAQLCFETSVLTFGSSVSVLGSNLIRSASSGLSSLQTVIDPGQSSSGHLDLNFSDSSFRLTAADPAGPVLAGIPAIGFLAVNYVNGNLTPGVLANYNGLFPHRGSVNCMNSSSSQNPCH